MNRRIRCWNLIQRTDSFINNILHLFIGTLLGVRFPFLNLGGLMYNFIFNSSTFAGGSTHPDTLKKELININLSLSLWPISNIYINWPQCYLSNIINKKIYTNKKQIINDTNDIF